MENTESENIKMGIARMLAMKRLDSERNYIHE